MNVLVCAATDFEYKACHKGILNNKNFTVLKTGVGPKNARRNLNKYLTNIRFQRTSDLKKLPDLIVSTGFSGANGTQLQTGDVVFSNEGSFQDFTQVEKWNLQSKAGLALSLAFKKAPFLTVSSLFDYKETDAEKNFIVDMESYALGEVARTFQVDFLALRIVTDTSKNPMPKFVYTFTNALFAEKSLPKRAKELSKGLYQSAISPKTTVSFLKTSYLWGKSLKEVWENVSKDLQ